MTWVALLLASRVGLADVTVDSSASATADSTTSFSWTHACDAGSDLVVAGLSWRVLGQSSVASTLSRVTCGDAGMIQAVSQSVSNSDTATAIYYLVAPPTGPQTLTATFTSQADMVIGGSVSFFGVDPANPIGAMSSTSGASVAASVAVASQPGDLVVDSLIFESNASAVTPSGSQIQEWLIRGTPNPGIWGGGSVSDGASSVQVTWTGSSSDVWGIGAVSVHASDGGVLVDSGVDAGADAGSDGGAPADGGLAPDAGADGGPSGSDGGPPLTDAGVGFDGGANPDAGAPSELDLRGWTCAQVPPLPESAFVLALGWGLTRSRRRRRQSSGVPSSSL